jgi:hypothetical protein
MNKIQYELKHVRDSVLVAVTVPGERWEIEFFEDSSVDVERFINTGEIADDTLLEQLFAVYGDSDATKDGE